MVIGIIGKTHGVKMARNPKPRARAMNWPVPWEPAKAAGAELAGDALDAPAAGFPVPGPAPGGPPLNSVYPAGIAGAAARVLGSIFSVAGPSYGPEKGRSCRCRP